MVGREGVLDALKQQLLAGGAVAVQGLPGAGKTALAVALTHDAMLREHFCDGVLWVGLGREPDTLALLGTWLNALVEAPDPTTHIREAARLVQAAIGTRRMLLVMDDAWASEPALAFKLGGPNCAHLLTTRLPAVAIDFAGAHAIKLSELDAHASAQLLHHHAPSLPPDALRQLTKAAGGLPLALTLMGRFCTRPATLGNRAACNKLCSTWPSARRA
ncbi:MAG: hypothetical protein HC853_10060 [Anaerolineae bacterium]|nr:hypothetical protein [Anaerolineae bacterium]